MAISPKNTLINKNNHKILKSILFLLIIFGVLILSSIYIWSINTTILGLSSDIDLSDVGRLRFRRLWILNNEIVSLYWKGLDDKIYYKNVDIATYNQVCKTLFKSGRDFTIANFLEEYNKLWDSILGQYRPEIELNSEFLLKCMGVISGTILYAIFLMEVVDRIYFPI